MKGLRALFDISSFFLIMIINLLLIALLCYYFKRKFENLEKAQSEQAKILYGLIEQNGAVNSHTSPEVERQAMELETLMMNQSSNEPTHLETKTINLQGNPIEESDDSEEDDSEEEYSDESDSDEEPAATHDASPPLEVTPDNIVDISKDLSELNEVPNEPIDLNISNLIPDVKQVNMGDDTNNLAKMTIKELNEIIKEKGLKTNKTMKKQDIIDLIEKSE